MLNVNYYKINELSLLNAPCLSPTPLPATVCKFYYLLP